ncbi:MAG: DNA repair protein RecO [Corallococcus sp.]|nr:DNA repair protein RecO [Bacillota bacterium]MCM1533890.1 DNA repair protein RecO [Corallococcus sp.]
MDVKTKAVALSATDYKESDKMILLYSLEYGKISVHARGIRKNSAKLKFCADQFCFGQYELAQTNGRFTLKTCEQLESFYSLREDIVRYYSACVIAECLSNYTEEGQSDPYLFVETLKALESLEEKKEPLAVVLRYLLGFFKLQGIALQLDSCISCGNRSQRLFLDLPRGGLVCDNCREAESSAVSARALSVCKMMDGISYDKTDNINASLDALKDALNLCYKYVSHSYFPLKSLRELIKLA